MTMQIDSANQELLLFCEAFGMNRKSIKMEKMINKSYGVKGYLSQNKKIRNMEQSAREKVIAFMDEWGGDYSTAGGRKTFITKYSPRCSKVQEVEAWIKIAYPYLVFEVIFKDEIPVEKRDEVNQLLARINMNLHGVSFIMDFEGGSIHLRNANKLTHSRVDVANINLLYLVSNDAVNEYADVIYELVNEEISLDEAISKAEED